MHNQNIQRGPTGNGMVGAECTTCHRETPPAEFGAHIPPGLEKPWHMPPPDMKMGFVGVTPAALCEQIPLKRRCRPEEVGNLIAFLASDECSYCTGAMFDVNGGWVML